MIERFKVSHPAFTSFSGDQEEVVRYSDHAAEVERLERENTALKLQAQSWAIEARGANATIAEAYQAVTEAKGEPGNWHGAEPVKSKITELTARAESAEARMEDAERMAALADRFLGEEQAKSKSLKANLRAVQTELARLQDKQSRATIAAKMGGGGEMVTDAMVERAARAVLRKRHPATPEKDMWLDPVVVEEARAALSASPRREGWQGMETALRFDDGSEIVIASYSGGGSAEGMFGQLSLMKTLADGTTLFRRYQAIDDWLDVDNLTFTAAPTQGGGE